MSHTTTFTGLKINNVTALETAIGILNGQLVNRGFGEMKVLQNAVPVLYYGTSQYTDKYGKDAKCDFVLRHSKAKYDLGLHYNEAEQSYEMVYDSYGGGTRSVFGYTDSELSVMQMPDESRKQSVVRDLGRFMNAYNTGMTVYEVNRQGYVVDEITEHNGALKLTLSATV